MGYRLEVMAEQMKADTLWLGAIVWQSRSGRLIGMDPCVVNLCLFWKSENNTLRSTDEQSLF